MSSKFLLAAVGTLALSTAALAQAPKAPEAPKAPAQPKTEAKDIVDTAMGTGMHNTLVAAIKAAGLVDALKGKGPFTVFAPTDDAFKKLPAGTLDSLLKPENKEKLGNILKFHVIAGAAVKAADVVKMKESAATLEGSKFMIEVKGKDVTLGNKTAMAKVVKADVETSNGVIHVIDTVLMPEAKKEEKKEEKKDAPKKGS